MADTKVIPITKPQDAVGAALEREAGLRKLQLAQAGRYRRQATLHRSIGRLLDEAAILMEEEARE